MQTEFDVVIMGAGVAGSTAAILLARAGWSVAIVERQRFPRRKVCGECIAASNLPLLEALGIGPAFELAAGAELHTVALMRGQHQVRSPMPEAKHEKYRWGRALGRELLDTLLLAQAQADGAVVFQPWAVQALDGGPGDWRCHARCVDSDARVQLRAAVAIAAHGSWEALPSERPTKRLQRRPSDLFAFKANFSGASLAEGLLAMLSFNGGYGGMVVADQGLTTVACCLRGDRLEALRREAPGQRAGDLVENLLRRACSGVGEALAGATRQDVWLAAGPIDPGIRLRADDGLLRIGNAAGEAHPIIGEGMSMALQSAWLLCAELLQAGRPPQRGETAVQHEIAHRYAAQWRHHFLTRLRLAASFSHVLMRPQLALPLVKVVQTWPGLMTLGARWGGKVRCAVPSSEITATLTRLAPSSGRAVLLPPAGAEQVQ
jgi:menaquinone-9 beta-reductase